MGLDFDRFSGEIGDFLCVETLKAIDYGILDLHRVEDTQLREVFHFLEELLTAELQVNYLDNDTGIFRVSRKGSVWCYKQERHVIMAETLAELEMKVTFENRIWYVFDDDLANGIWR